MFFLGVFVIEVSIGVLGVMCRVKVGFFFLGDVSGGDFYSILVSWY